jgi:transposase
LSAAFPPQEDFQQALAGRVRDHHRFLIGKYLDGWEALDERIRRMETEIDKRIRPFETKETSTTLSKIAVIQGP